LAPSFLCLIVDPNSGALAAAGNIGIQAVVDEAALWERTSTCRAAPTDDREPGQR
jgi:hypothetical protein